jgi:2-succinyl-6-hydroxy-2,4-cyclohexadiene-1-carboxylate synthase
MTESNQVQRMQTFHVKINGLRFRVVEYGRMSGSALVLLHGFTGCADLWQPFFPSWGRMCWIVAVDLIGHGGTDAPPAAERYSMRHAVRDLEVLLDTLGIDRVHLLGYSLGGRVALNLATNRPRQLASLILESSSPGLSDAEERRERIKRDEALAEFIEQKGISAFVDYWQNIPLFATQRTLSADVRNKQREQRLRNRTHGLANSLRGMGTGAQPPLWDQLATFSVPVLLITGEQDRKFVAISTAMHNQLPRSEQITVRGAGHTVHLEQPSAMESIVGSWLQKHNL